MKIGVPLKREPWVLAVANTDPAFVTTQLPTDGFIIIYRICALYVVCFGYAIFTDYIGSDEPLLHFSTSFCDETVLRARLL